MRNVMYRPRIARKALILAAALGCLLLAAAPCRAMSDDFNGDVIEWDIDVGGLASCSSGLTHCYESALISPEGWYSLNLTIPASAFENLQSGGYIWLSVHTDPSDVYEKNYRYRTETVSDGGTEKLVYYLLEYWASQSPLPKEQGPYDVPQGGVSVSYGASYALDPQAFEMMDFSYSRDGAGFAFPVTVNLSPSARHWIGNAPWQEGDPWENPDTEYADEEGPGQCAVNGQGLPFYAVNSATRGLVISDMLFSAPAPGPDMTLAMTYSPVPSRTGMLGSGWAFSLDAAVTANCSSATLRKGSHQTVSFSGTLCPAPAVFPATLVPQTGNFDKLVRVADGFEYTPKGTRETYRFTVQDEDGAWLLQEVTDANGNALTIVRNPDFTIASVADAAGRTATFDYDADKRCVAIHLPGGTQALFVYASGDLVRVTDPAGVVTQYVYDVSHYLVSMTAGGKTASFVYDGVDKGALASLTDAGGNVVTYSRNSSTNAITRTGAGNRSTVYLSENGRTTRVTDPLSLVTSTTYFANGLPKRLTEPGNVLTDYVFDASANLTSLTRSSGGLSQSWSMTYDGDGNLLTVTDPLSRIWAYSYDAAGNPLTAATPMGLQTSFVYDGKGQPLTVTLPGGRVWSYAYDAQGNPVSRTDPLARVTAFGYDAVGNLTLARDPRGAETRFEYDANRRRTRTVWPGGASRHTAYGCCAPESFTDERGGVTRYDYDGLLRLTRATFPGGGSTSYESDANGDLTRVTDALEHATTLTYDAGGRLTGAADPLDNEISLSYGVLGRPITFIDQRGNWTSFNYDTLGRYIGLTDPLNHTASLTRDAAGNVIRKTNARGGVVDFTLDGDGRLIAKKYGAAEVASFAYHAQTGDLASFSSASYGTVTYARDALGRATRIDYPDGTSVSFTYDASGNMNGLTYPGNLTAVTTYDARNRVSALAVDALTMSLGYDAAGNLVSESRSNGVSSAYGYDADQRLISVSHARSGAPFVQLAYVRDATGKVTGESGFQPREVWQESAAAAGNFDAAGRQTYFGAENMTSDNDGNVTAMTGARNIAISYDPENRPTSITVSGVASTFVYDALGNRVRRTRSGVVTNYHYDHLGRLLFETDGTGATTMLYVYADRRLVASGTQTGGFRFHHMDKTGSALALTGASGSVVAAYAYDPFGRVLDRTGPADTAFTFSGAYGVMEEGEGLYFMRNRYYDAVTGRFLHKDPIGIAGGFNPYRFVQNDPVARIDPLGLEDFEPHGYGGEGGYDVNTAEGTYDLASGRAPHTADPASDEEALVAGIIVAATVGAMIAAPALCAAPEAAGGGGMIDKLAYSQKLMRQWGGRLPGVDPRSGAGFDWLMNAPMPQKDKVRVFTGALKYVFRTGTGW